MPEYFIAPEYKEVFGPLIFLAGPIQGAPLWQPEAMDILRDFGDVHVASPRRLEKHVGEFTEHDYNTQVDWEHHYLDLAAANGVILFWLPVEAEQVPGRAYAQTSRFELGEAVARHYLKGVNVVVGIEKGFTNERYLRRTIMNKAPGIPLCDTLGETCQRAWKMARSSG